jgi:SAM-dependent methyltransferase
MNQVASYARKRLGNAHCMKDRTIPAAALPVQSTLDALFLTPDSIVVELGEDAGRFTLPVANYFAKKSGSGIVYACDFTTASVERLQQKVKDAHLEYYVRPCDLESVRPYSIPVPNEYVDAILAVNPFEYQADPESYLAECLRILRAGGGMLIASRSDLRTASRHREHSFDMPLDAAFSALKRHGAEICTSLEVPGYTWSVLVVKPLVHFPS